MALIAIRVTTRSARPGIGDWSCDPTGRTHLEIRVAAPPADGAANAEVVKLLAKALGVPKGDVRIVSGETGRMKRVDVPLDEQDVRARL